MPKSVSSTYPEILNCNTTEEFPDFCGTITEEFLDLYGTLTKEFLDCIVGYGVGSAQMGEWFVLHSD